MKKKLLFVKGNHGVTSAWIGTPENGFWFGRYRLDDKKKHWHIVECFGFEHDVCATPEGCENWLNDKFAKLQEILEKA